MFLKNKHNFLVQLFDFSSFFLILYIIAFIHIFSDYCLWCNNNSSDFALSSSAALFTAVLFSTFKVGIIVATTMATMEEKAILVVRALWISSNHSNNDHGRRTSHHSSSGGHSSSHYHGASASVSAG